MSVPVERTPPPGGADPSPLLPWSYLCEVADLAAQFALDAVDGAQELGQLPVQEAGVVLVFGELQQDVPWWTWRSYTPLRSSLNEHWPFTDRNLNLSNINVLISFCFAMQPSC